MTGKAKRQFFALYKEYFPKIYRYVYYRSGQHRDTADDLTSEVFLKAYEKFEQFDQTQPFGPWIYTIARNHIIDHYRTTKESVPLELVENVLASSEDIVSDAAQKEEVGKLMECLHQLAEDDQELIRLRYLGENSYEEMAAILGKNVNALQVGVHRALNRLRDIVNQNL